MLSCLWQLWDWIDPKKMESQKETLQNSTITSNEVTSNEVLKQTQHQHSGAPQYYPYVHPHSQMMLTKGSPLHLSIPPNQHMQFQTSHRHFQYYPQYATNPNENVIYPVKNQIYVHQHTQRVNNSQPQSQVWTPQLPNQEVKTDNDSSAKNTTTQVKQSKEGEKKKTSTNNSHLRSPTAKRPPDAPVTMQGWLHKQGSEGLMLWKKRWFVLSDYCLFYYKGSSEEKLLGSILLPSYKVSVCAAEDRINRKFAFKCEHANMRTYILAADSHELMMQWVHVLNLACNLQNNIEKNDEQLVVKQPNSFNSNAEYSQSIKQNNLRKLPAHAHTSSNTTDMSSSSQQELTKYNQPLYANAPPKPRRLTEGYTSPSPEVLDKYNYSQYNFVTTRAIAKSPVDSYRQINSTCKTPQPNCMLPNEHVLRELNSMPHNVDRRTPDTYGRSKLNKFRNPSDYEDIYSDQAIYKRPLSPVVANNVIKKSYPTVDPAYKSYTPVNMLDPRDLIQYDPVQMRKSPITISRPHSADFLEYKTNQRESDQAVLNRQQPRPKSSLDINKYAGDDRDIVGTPNEMYHARIRPTERGKNINDNYFYSQERYAEKMRKSAQYLQKMPYRYQAIDNSHRKHKENQSFCQTPMFSNMRPPNYNNLHVNDNSSYQPTRSRSVLSEGSILCAQDIENESASPDFSLRQEQYLNCNVRNLPQDSFTRSASARLAQNACQDNRILDDKMGIIEGERKREESMKRLLEWKQRMLQSPLNRKAHCNRGYPSGLVRSDNPYIYPTDYNMEMKPKKTVPVNRRSASNLLQYNSYSSDDEENGSRSKSKMHSQAGRTADTFTNNSVSLTPAHVTSTIPFTVLRQNEDVALDGDEHALTKPLKEFNKDSSNIAHVSSLRSEYSDSFQSPNTVLDVIKSNGALVKSILSEFQNPSGKESPRSVSNTPTKDTESLIEGNYMPMTPKKNVLVVANEDGSDNTLAFNEPDENHYVEMTQNVDPVLLESTKQIENIDQQPYEIVCFGENKIEPVYMELTGSQGGNVKELPDILKSPQRQQSKENKSDSSDADDEASKDLDSLDNSQPRFSLSDNFRPASYYLGVSKTLPDFQDSSDSELVSPPPIPASSPPLDDDDYSSNAEEFNKIRRPKKEQTLTDRQHFSRNSDQFFNSNNKYVNKNSEIKRSVQSLDVKTSFLSLKDFKDHRLYDTTDADDRYCHFSQNSDSLIEIQGKGSISKRRPVSEQLSEISNPLELSAYYKNNQDPEDQLNDSSHDYENLILTKSSEKILLEESMDKSVARCRPESSCSVSVEICSFLANSNCSTPVVGLDASLNVSEIPLDSYFSPLNQQMAPYYYSDLSNNISSLECSATMLTLNNQRESINGSKKDITHIINPIKCNSQVRNFSPCKTEQSFDDNSVTLAAEARSVSVDFLNLTDKLGSIDKKNIYESDTLKRQKLCLVPKDPEARNFYLTRKNDKFNPSDKTIRKTHSLEGLLENVLNETPNANTTPSASRNEEATPTIASEGSYLWEEDSIWRERLRSVSQRHTRSMDDLDCIDDSEKKKSPRGISRDVTYVNDILYKQDKNQEKPGKNEIKKKGSFLIDREKLRQWDLMSSAPSDDQLLKITSALQAPEDNNAGVEIGEGSCEPRETAPETASGSISLNTRDAQPVQRDTFPRSISGKRTVPSHLQNAHSQTNLDGNYIPINKDCFKSQNHCDLSQEDMRNLRNELSPSKMSVSAGELLGRTHEELVLLLIQLRRQSAQTFQAIESCYNEIDILQAQCHNVDQAIRLENLQKLEQIKQNLLELEKQYEKGKPLVNLVDNMVKLGSLYRIPSDKNDMARYIRDRLEFNQHIQERRLLAEEKREWNRLDPSHIHLQEKVQQLYQLDRLIHEESENLQNLQKDKEDIERALGGLRCRLTKGFNNPEEIEQARRQQIMLENELSRVHLMLAENSKKLEETIAGNSRLEQELLVLKQKLQISRQQRISPQFSNAGDSLPYVMGSSAVLESDLQRVQKKIGDLQKQREELSLQVRQLTDRSNNLQTQQKIPFVNDTQQNKKKTSSYWRETDLDTMITIDHGYSTENQSCTPTSMLYVNTDAKNDSEYFDRVKSSDSTSDDTPASSNLLEKQEIKTVRIVKRESERRQRDREKSTINKCETLIEDDSSQNSSVLFRPTPPQKSPGFDQNSTLNIPQKHTSKSPELSPIFKSEAARQIITEVSSQDAPKQTLRRTIPREKRRHYTAPNNNLIVKSLHQLPTDGESFEKIDTRRARDDLDIERALRQRIDAPDIVRSTLSNKELKYNEQTIDNILSTPNKILIPERYIPEQLPQLTAEEKEHRLRKVESIKKMLSDTAIISTATSSHTDDKSNEKKTTPSTKGVTGTSMTEEKKQREHLLQLNQILAKQVMEMSQVVAGSNETDEK